MDAVTYLKTKARICKQSTCDKCMLSESFSCSRGYEQNDPEFAVMVVEEWAKKHGTNGARIEQMIDGSGAVVYTDQESMDAVVIKIPKAWWEEESEEWTK